MTEYRERCTVSGMKELIWFNVSVFYASVAAGLAANSVGLVRAMGIALAVNGALWSIYRALVLIRVEDRAEKEQS